MRQNKEQRMQAILESHKQGKARQAQGPGPTDYVFEKESSVLKQSYNTRFWLYFISFFKYSIKLFISYIH